MSNFTNFVKASFDPGNVFGTRGDGSMSFMGMLDPAGEVIDAGSDGEVKADWLRYASDEKGKADQKKVDDEYRESLSVNKTLMGGSAAGSKLNYLTYRE